MKPFFSFLQQVRNHPFFLETIENAIQITLGPSGKNALVSKPKQELEWVTKGSSLIKSISFSTSLGNNLVRLLEQAALKTSKVSGDGSTTTLLLTCELLQRSFRFLQSGYNPIFLSNGLKKIAYFVTEKVLLFSTPLSCHFELFGLFETSIGQKLPSSIFLLFKETLSFLEKDSLLIVEESKQITNEIELVQGIELDRGFTSSYFINDVKNYQVVYDLPYVFISNAPISSLLQIQPLLEYCQLNQRPLVILTDEIQKETLSALLLNTIKKKLQVVVIKYTAIKFLKTGMLEDIALVTHTKYSPQDEQGKRTLFLPEELGQAEKVIVQKEKTTFFLSKFAKLLATRKINELNRELVESETEYEKELIQTRIGRLSGNLTKLKLAPSPYYDIEKMKQILETLLFFVKTSLEEGCVPGGSSCYLYLREELITWATFNLIGEEIFACQIVMESLIRPFSQLIINSSSFFSFEIIESLGYPFVYDAIQKRVVKSSERGLLDSTKMVRSSLWNALTLSSTLLTSE